MSKYSEEFIQETKKAWQPYYQEALTDQDAIEIIDNFTGFMKLLIKWDKRQKEREANNGKEI